MNILLGNGRRANAVVAALLFAAALCRFIKLPGVFDGIGGLVRSFIYIGLLVAWGVTIKHRVIHSQVRHYLISIDILMVLWFVTRTVKFNFVYDIDITRMLWYSYYIPMLFIPVLVLFVALSLGKPEGTRLPRKVLLLFIPTVALIFSVLSNDIHELVFTFAPRAARTDANSSYNIVYWLIVCWAAASILVAMSVMIAKCRVPSSKKVLWLPIIPMLIIGIYGLSYAFNVPYVRMIAGDVTWAFCVLCVATFECCLRCRLILSNVAYDELFNISALRAQITDTDFEIKYSSGNARELSTDVFRTASEVPKELDGEAILNSMPLTYGHIFWEEDVSQELAVRARLKRTGEELKAENDLIESEITMKENIAITDTRNRLYDALAMQLAPQLEEIERITCDADANVTQMRTQLKKLCVLGAYIKRRCNLVILNEENKYASSAELGFCLRESADYLRQYGADCTVHCRGEGLITLNSIILAYDLFEKAVECVLPSLTALLITCDTSSSSLCLKLQAECSNEDFCTDAFMTVPLVSKQSVDTKAEYIDGVLYISLVFPKGGDAA